MTCATRTTPRCSAPPTRRLCARAVTTASTTPISSHPNTNASRLSTPPLPNSPLSAISVRYFHKHLLSSLNPQKIHSWICDFTCAVGFSDFVIFGFDRREELSCSVSRTEQFCAESATFRFTPPTNIPRSIVGSFLQGLSSLLPLLFTHLLLILLPLLISSLRSITSLLFLLLQFQTHLRFLKFQLLPPPPKIVEICY